MRCLNKHIYHFSALLGPVTVDTDAVIFFFQLQIPTANGEHQDTRT